MSQRVGVGEGRRRILKLLPWNMQPETIFYLEPGQKLWSGYVESWSPFINPFGALTHALVQCYLYLLIVTVWYIYFRSGNLSDMAKAGSVHEYLVELHEKYGEIVGFWWGKEYVISLSSVEYWKEIRPLFDKPCKINEWIASGLCRHSLACHFTHSTHVSRSA